MVEDSPNSDFGDNVASLAEAKARRGKKTPDSNEPPTKEDKRAVVQLTTGNLHLWVRQSEAAIIAGGEELFKQDGRIVKPVWQNITMEDGREVRLMKLLNITSPYLMSIFSRHIRFEKWNVMAGEFLPCNAPPNIADTYLSMDGKWNLRYLVGVVTAPTLRYDGSLIDKPGYDEATKLYYSPMTTKFEGILDKPTKADAVAGLELLKDLIKGYPLEGVKLAVALSAIITTVVRRALPTAPMHAFSASAAGSGKSMLVDIASMIATGTVAAVTSTGRDGHGDAELEKRLTASMLAGDAVLSLDNLETPLGGELLCQLLTQTNVKLRPLGKSINYDVPITTSFFATGNNLTVVGDLTRRVLVASFEVNEERPELRRFDFDPLEMVRAERGKYVAACLNIVRAYLQSGEDVGEAPLGSYGRWSKFVREPLIWLGVGDPVDIMEEVRAGDPRLMELTNLMLAWAETFGEQSVPIDQVVKAAQEQQEQAGPNDEHWVRPALHDSIMAVAAAGQFVNTKRLSFYLKRNKSRVVKGMKFEEKRGGRFVEWVLVGAGAAEVGDSVPGWEVKPNANWKSSGAAVGVAPPESGGGVVDDEIPFN